MELLEIKDLDKNHQIQFEEIYHEAFPPNEQQPTELIYKRIKENKEVFLAAYIKEELVAFALLFDLQNTDYFLLDYLAVKNNKRNAGLGGKLMQKVIAYSFGKNKGVLLEVNHPNQRGKRLQNTSRIQFYQKYGARIVENLIYKLPDLERKNNPAHQFLMIISLQNNIDSLSKAEVENLLNQLYVQLYQGVYNTDDLEKMKEGLLETNFLSKI